MTEKQAEGVVLNILRVREQQFRKGGRNRGEPLSINAKQALTKKQVGRSFLED